MIDPCAALMTLVTLAPARRKRLSSSWGRHAGTSAATGRDLHRPRHRVGSEALAEVQALWDLVPGTGRAGRVGGTRLGWRLVLSRVLRRRHPARQATGSAILKFLRTWRNGISELA